MIDFVPEFNLKPPTNNFLSRHVIILPSSFELVDANLCMISMNRVSYSTLKFSIIHVNMISKNSTQVQHATGENQMKSQMQPRQIKRGRGQKNKALVQWDQESVGINKQDIKLNNNLYPHTGSKKNI